HGIIPLHVKRIWSKPPTPLAGWLVPAPVDYRIGRGRVNASATTRRPSHSCLRTSSSMRHVTPRYAPSAGSAMRCYLVNQSDDQHLTAGLAERDERELPPGDVTIRVAYSSLNYKDA